MRPNVTAPIERCGVQSVVAGVIWSR